MAVIVGNLSLCFRLSDFFLKIKVQKAHLYFQVHEYQEACVDKLEKFIKGEVNKGGSSTLSPAPNAPYFSPKNGPMWKTRSKTNLSADP